MVTTIQQDLTMNIVENNNTSLNIINSNLNNDITDTHHLLNNRWNLWGHLPQENDWSLSSYKKIITFNTIESVIAINNILPDDLIKNCMLFIMKEGINPIWEDSHNRNGGCFSYKISNKYICKVWKNLSYVLTGETISNNIEFVNSVNGITISPKKNFCIIKIWLSNCNYQNPTLVTNIIKFLVPEGCLFKVHNPEY
jgi:hypothetical protein